MGTDPEEADEWCYLVKTDPHPGLESRTISVPEDSMEATISSIVLCLPVPIINLDENFFPAISK